VPTQYTALANSSYLDYDSYRTGALSPTGTGAVGNFTVNVALVLDRANDPTALLHSNWGTRQQQLEALNDSGTLWSTYGANQANYNQVLSQLGQLGVPTVDQLDPVNGYVSSAASRTIWVQVDHTNFATLFGTPLVAGHDQAGHAVTYWQGNLSLPQGLAALGVKGLWFDTDMFGTVLPPRPYAVGRGLFYPEIRKLADDTEDTLLILPPRYKSHEDAVATAYGIAEVRDVGLLKGFKAIWRWLKTLFGGVEPQPATT